MTAFEFLCCVQEGRAAGAPTSGIKNGRWETQRGHRRATDSIRTHLGAPIDPRLGRLELSGEPEQDRLFAVAGEKVQPDR